MPSPRLDPDTRPMLLGAQIITRPTADQYGAERKTPRPRPITTRNGLPEPRYRYQGTGQSMSPAEARYWLTSMKGTTR